MKLRFLQVFHYYPSVAAEIYRTEPLWAEQPFVDQLERLRQQGFAAVHLIAPYLDTSRYESSFVISNARPLQTRWYFERTGKKYQGDEWERDLVRAQIELLKPDILYFADPLTFDGWFLASLSHRPKLVIGWRAANVPEGTRWDGYDLILSSLSGIRDLAPHLGAKGAAGFWPGVPRWISRALEQIEAEADVCFCGQWTTNQHQARNKILCDVAESSEYPTEPFSLRLHLSVAPGDCIPPLLEKFNRGPVFGIEMQKALRKGRIGLDARATHQFGANDIGRNETANMRLFEVTGVGRFLLTEHRENLAEAFTPGKEIETFRDTGELLDKIRFYSKNHAAREEIAQRGYQRALSDHSMETRSYALDRIISEALGIKPLVSSRATGPTDSHSARGQPTKSNMDATTPPSAQLAILSQAIDFLKQGDFDAAYRSVLPVTKAEPTLRDICLVAGVAACKLHRPQEGAIFLKKEVACHPDNEQARLLLKELEAGLGNNVKPSADSLETFAPRNAAERETMRLLGQAIDACRRNDGPLALRYADEALQAESSVPERHWIRAICLNLVGRHEEALKEAENELAINPSHKGARGEFERLSAALGKKATPLPNPEQRPFHSALPLDVLQSIQSAGHVYEYRGVPMIKNPFDFALYPRLLWNVKPKTIIEIGSKNGGSALWFGDMLNNFGIDGHVYSLDIVEVTDVSHPRVTFIKADGRDLGAVLTPEFLAKLPRPWLVIEDADHSYETSSAVLKFFHPHVAPGEHLIIEDGIISDLAKDPQANSGPHRALKEFFQRHPGEYDIDSSYTDFFGYNFTWCTNGFLRKKKYPINAAIEKSLITEFNTDDPAPIGAESQMSQNERFQLYYTARKLAQFPTSRFRFVEIGSYSGASLRLLAKAFERLDRPFEGISIEPGGTPEFYQTLTDLAGKIQHLKMLSQEARQHLDSLISRDGIRPQLIFVDGDHSFEGVKNDALNYYPLLASGGFIVFHDFLPPLSDENRSAILFHHGGSEPGIRQACLEVMEGKFGLQPYEAPLLYPTDPTQTQSHLPVIPEVFSTLRIYQKP